MNIFNVVFPVYLIFTSAFFAQKQLKLDIKSISTVALYLMVPCLVFKTFYQAELNGIYLQIISYSLLLSFSIILIVNAIAYFQGFSSSEKSGLLLSTAFMNNGNMGLPIVLFAFGQKAAEYAVTIMTFHTLLMSTVGVYIAAKGQLDLKKSFISAAKMPILHSALLGLIWNIFSIPLPENIFKAISLIANAGIPTIMIALGLQLAEIKLESLVWTKISLGLFLRLIISPLIALFITFILKTDILLGKVMILEAAMPTAAITTLYSLQYNSEPEMVSSITFLSTLTAMFSISFLLYFIA